MYLYYKINASENSFRLLKRKIKLLKLYEHCDLFSLQLNYYMFRQSNALVVVCSMLVTTECMRALLPFTFYMGI